VFFAIFLNYTAQELVLWFNGIFLDFQVLLGLRAVVFLMNSGEVERFKVLIDRYGIVRVGSISCETPEVLGVSDQLVASFENDKPTVVLTDFHGDVVIGREDEPSVIIHFDWSDAFLFVIVRCRRNHVLDLLTKGVRVSATGLINDNH
jgi:hypothetical protein